MSLRPILVIIGWSFLSKTKLYVRHNSNLKPEKQKKAPTVIITYYTCLLFRLHALKGFFSGTMKKISDRPIADHHITDETDAQGGPGQFGVCDTF